LQKSLLLQRVCFSRTCSEDNEYRHKTIKSSGNFDKDVETLVQKVSLVLVLEEHIKQYPRRWVWFYERWKTSSKGNVANMRNKLKVKIIIRFIVIFVSFAFFIGCKAEKTIVEEAPPVFEQAIERFTITETHKGELKMILEAESAVINESKNIAHLKLPIIKFYNEGSYVSTLVTESADINTETYDIKGNGKCTVDSANNEHLQTTDLMYNAKKELVYSNNNVKITKPGETVYGTSFEADTKLEKIVIKNQRIIVD
jgi:LPS export ABC transporter protein LptC